MNHLFKNKRKKSPETPLQNAFSETSANIPAGPVTYSNVGSEDRMGDGCSQIVFRDRMDEDREPASVTETSGVAISIAEQRDSRKDKDAGYTGGIMNEPTERTIVVKRARKGTLLGDATTRVDAAKVVAERFGPLKAVLCAVPAFYANSKETTTIGNKIENLLSRIVTLEERFDSRPSDVAEQRRRDELIRKFEHMEKRLWSLAGNPQLQMQADKVQDNEVTSLLLEDLQEVIFNYQVVQQWEILNEQRNLMNPAEAAVLNNFRSAHGAEYRHGNRNGCLKGTRGPVLDVIEHWTRDFDKSPLYWLNGLAGTGKSTIAQTVAERMFADGRLGASFFCSRDFEDRSNLQFIFPTLAVQLARRYPEFRSIFVPLARGDPEVARESLYNQMNELIMRPLRESTISTVIVIDALDECKGEEATSAILSVLGRFVSELPKVKFFITGRPEPRIREGFRLPLLVEATDIFILHQVQPDQVNNDIRRFLKHKFSELAHRRYGLDDWPTTEQLDLLCKRAAGLFVFAVATVKFLDHKNSDPRRKLDLLLQSPESNVREGRTKLTVNTTLDSLYLSILQEAFGDDDPEDDSIVRSVLGAVILATNPLSPSTIAALLGFHTTAAFLRLLSTHSLLVLEEDINYPVRPFHKSFPDFITDPTRCSNQRFQVSPPDHHLELLIGCLELMNQTLGKNICNLPETVKNSEVEDLQERIDQFISPALQYACKSWHRHLTNKNVVRTPRVISTLHQFLEKKFLCWLEVLSVLNGVRNAIDALEMTAKLLEESQTLDLVNDFFRFVIGFFELISISVPHIYHSALLLSPKTSIVLKLYGPQATPMARVIKGTPTSWDLSIATRNCISDIRVITWSPCSKFIAIACRDSPEVAILDGTTLKKLHTLFPDDGYSRILWKCLRFSPDSCLLVGYLGHTSSYQEVGWVLSWDLHTGGLISCIITPDSSCDSVTYSECGTMLGGYFQYSEKIIIYDILSAAEIFSHSVEEWIRGDIWTHDGHLQYAVVNLKSITIWEVSFTSGHAPIQFCTLPTPKNFPEDPEASVFSPTLSLLAFTLLGKVFVWDAQGQKILLDSSTGINSSMHFSPSGQFFAYGSDLSGFCLYKKSPGGYLPHRKLVFSDAYSYPNISPDGGSIISSNGPVLQLYHTNSLPSLQSTPSAVQKIQHAYLEFLPDESSVAIAESGEAIAILNLKSGNPQMVIDVGMEIHGMEVVKNEIIVVGNERCIIWELPAGNYPPGTKWSIDHSIQTITFKEKVWCHGISISPNLDHMVGSDYDSLYIFNMYTGERLHSNWSRGHEPGFTLDGGKVLCPHSGHGMECWKVVEDEISGTTKLECLGQEFPLVGFPWCSSFGYKITDDGWAFSSNGKRLLWLPPQWQSDVQGKRKWNGKILALLYYELPEVVILELEG